MEKHKSPTEVQRKFRTNYGKNEVGPTRIIIKKWYRNFVKIGSCQAPQRTTPPRVVDHQEVVDHFNNQYRAKIVFEEGSYEFRNVLLFRSTCIEVWKSKVLPPKGGSTSKKQWFWYSSCFCSVVHLTWPLWIFFFGDTSKASFIIVIMIMLINWRQLSPQPSKKWRENRFHQPLQISRRTLGRWFNVMVVIQRNRLLSRIGCFIHNP